MAEPDDRLADQLEEIRRMRQQTEAMMNHGRSRARVVAALSILGGALFMLAVVFATLNVIGRAGF